jgi:DNA-binding NtrC family response regulator
MVLFVDDEEQICSNLAKLLKPSGYETVATTNPHEALDLARRSEIDIAVIDYMMPEMNGIDLVRELLKEDPRILCVILTAYGNVDSCNLAYQAGVVRFMEKPARAEALRKLFRELLSKKDNHIAPLAEIARLVSDSTNGEDEDLLSGDMFSLEDFKHQAVKRYLTRVATICKGNAKDMASLTKLTLPSIYRLLSLHDISIKDFAKTTADSKDKNK